MFYLAHDGFSIQVSWAFSIQSVQGAGHEMKGFSDSSSCSSGWGLRQACLASLSDPICHLLTGYCKVVIPTLR
jgi:hypothetical protein